MNPIDVHDNFVTPLTDPPAADAWGNPASFGSMLSSDAIVQLSIDELSKFVAQQSAMCWGRYTGLLQEWESNNEHGIYQPAPGPAVLATVNQAAADAYFRTAKGGASVIVYYEKWSPAAAPGTIFTPPASATAQTARAANPVGDKPLPGTTNLFPLVGGGYSEANVGEMDPTSHYVLALEEPLNPNTLMWIKVS